MAQKRGIWQRLIRGNGDGQAEQTAVSEGSMAELLETEYGLAIRRDSVTVEELSKRNYRRMTGDELARINQIMQYVPQIVAGSAYSAAFRAASKDTFRVICKPRSHLGKSHHTANALSALCFNEKNQLEGSAELIANDAKLTMNSASQIALGVFNVASLVTGQYFISQVNAKLSALSSSVKRLESLLDAQRHGELKAAAQELTDIINRVDFITRDADRTNSAIAQIHDIQHIANTGMNTCQELIQSELRDMNPGDKASRISERIDAIGRNIIEYQYATQLYGIATLLEVQMRNVADPDELRAYRSQIGQRVAQFRQDYALCRRSTDEYIEQASALNGAGFIQSITSSTARNLSAMSGGKMGFIFDMGGRAVSFADELLSGHKRRRRDGVEAQISEYFERLSDAVALDSPCSAIDMYIQAVGKDIEFVKVGDECYTNLPEPCLVKELRAHGTAEA